MKKYFLIALLVSGCVTSPESGRRAVILTSEADENSLGKQGYQEVLSKSRVSSNARWNGILQRVGTRIRDASRHEGFDWEFKLLESAEKNAFCLPGGKVAFYTGIFPVAQNEAGLAAIMGHEVAHATARHAGQRLTIAFGTGLVFEGLNAIMGGGRSQQRQLLLAALGVGAQVGVALPFSRANESEADEIGLVYMARAGYDPAEAVRVWERFSKEGGGLPKFLSTHPPSPERAQELQKQLHSVRPVYQTSAQYGVGEKL